ncbi:hypothetical protein J7905_01475 [Vibrio parahaemolyticus]|uniref:hypothetical protein n=1 Tax=Vibrio parahaemolyticus TaxID=670 RepID=UPI001D8BB788|nr:hypothetical protein [Vibrio parahaemolyticus]EGQ9152900.1 hypothetical protein [Vibrio parahaemolyticus]EJE4159004.1 hypothetical protein [Vibrio parahaemolyticus]EJG1286768.1 hypothetical protein [Vibrio parahaemolyticus]EJG1296118.1 hypothetical protein [Vibrio parahaemolyticus]EJG1329214.1 hypothetical protein [Vibrio parahaemolyticus]
MKTDNRPQRRFNVRGIPYERLLKLAEQNNLTPNQMLLNLIMDAELKAPENNNENLSICK